MQATPVYVYAERERARLHVTGERLRKGEVSPGFGWLLEATGFGKVGCFGDGDGLRGCLIF